MWLAQGNMASHLWKRGVHPSPGGERRLLAPEPLSFQGSGWGPSARRHPDPTCSLPRIVGGAGLAGHQHSRRGTCLEIQTHNKATLPACPSSRAGPETPGAALGSSGSRQAWQGSRSSCHSCCRPGKALPAGSRDK